MSINEERVRIEMADRYPDGTHTAADDELFRISISTSNSGRIPSSS
jgi:hypothetical protein